MTRVKSDPFYIPLTPIAGLERFNRRQLDNMLSFLLRSGVDAELILVGNRQYTIAVRTNQYKLAVSLLTQLGVFG